VHEVEIGCLARQTVNRRPSDVEGAAAGGRPRHPCRGQLVVPVTVLLDLVM
jgi:hypothetical protein